MEEPKGTCPKCKVYLYMKSDSSGRVEGKWPLFGSYSADDIKKIALKYLPTQNYDHAKYIRCRAVKALGEIRAKKAVKPLCKLILDGNQYHDIRIEAIKALGEISDCSAAGFLCDILLSDINDLVNTNREILMETIRALVRIGGSQSTEALNQAKERRSGFYTAEIKKALADIVN